MTVVGSVLIGIGVVLILTAGIGLLRFPDVLTRANAATKAAGFGVACVLAGVAFVFATPEAGTKLTIAVVLQFATAPIGGHVIGRAAYRAGAPLWEGTVIDELAGHHERIEVAGPGTPSADTPELSTDPGRAVDD